MASEEQIDRFLKSISDSNPIGFFKSVNNTNAGIGAFLGFLVHSGGEATAGSIAEALSVSTARVAILLKKMSERGLITKEKSVLDARVTIVRLTEFGRVTAQNMVAEMKASIGLILDKIGEDRLNEFVSISREINEIVKESTSFSEK